jgi:hypothetical protein
MRKQTTVFINNNTSNPIAVECMIRGQKENGSWYWEIERIISVELSISDKVGIDITKQVLRDKRAEALLLNQVNDEADQIIESFEESKTAA